MSGRIVHLLRHGETALTGRLVGHLDCPVTPAGMVACLDQVEGLEVAAIVTSDLQRARACAEAIGASMALPVTRDARWRELDFGAWDGLSTAEIDAAALGAFWDDPDASPPPGGERWSTLLARVREALAALPEGPVLVVTHGGAMRAVLARLCGFDQRQLWAFDLPCAALLSLRVWAEDGQAIGGGQIIGLCG